MTIQIETAISDTPPPALSVQKKRGFTLTEIAIVLGIIGLILGAIWVAAAAVYANQRVTHANTTILQIAQAVRGLYATSSVDTGLTMNTLGCANALPADLVTGTCAAGNIAMVSPFPGGATAVRPTTDGFGFYIDMGGLTQSACINLLMAVAGASRDPGLFSATAQTANGVLAAGATGVPANLVAATPALANAAVAGNFGGCTAAAPIGVTFAFSLKS